MTSSFYLIIIFSFAPPQEFRVIRNKKTRVEKKRKIGKDYKIIPSCEITRTVAFQVEWKAVVERLETACQSF